MNQAKKAQPAKKAFNLIIEGVGYPNRLRFVQPKKGDPYRCCTINAMMGVEGAVDYVRIDCRVVGEQALVATRILYELSKDKNNKIIVGFRASDPQPDFYDYPKKDTGEQVHGEGLKARLLQLTFAKVNGETFEIPLVERPDPSPKSGDGMSCEDGVAPKPSTPERTTSEVA